MTDKNHPDHKKHKNLKVGIRLNKTSVDIKNKYGKDEKMTDFINRVILYYGESMETILR